MRKSNGFTFIEVLIGMSLLMIVFLNMGGLRLLTLQCSREALMQAIALQQLQSMAQMYVVNVHDFYNTWNLYNQKLLPDGRGEVVKMVDRCVFRISWRSVLLHEWHCRSKAKSHYACLEVEALQ